MKGLECGNDVRRGLIAGAVAWIVFIATLVCAAILVPDLPAHPGRLFTQRGGVQAGGFIAGWWIAIAGFTSCVVGFIRDFRGLHCLLGVVPAALSVANPWSVLVFVQFIGG